MDTRTPRRAALLTWNDIRDAAEDLDGDLKSLVLEIANGKDPTSPTGATTADGPWFIKKINVRGHVGIGEDPVSMALRPAPGLTVISGRNGTGKTSLADAVRHAVSSGAEAKYDLLADNIHYSHRAVVVALTNGTRDIEIHFGSDKVVRWVGPLGNLVEPPAEWTEAFARYMPVLLYPEISPIINDPSNLHEFLKGALEMTALADLQRALKVIRDDGRAAHRKIETAHGAALEGVRKTGNGDLAALLETSGYAPAEPACADILAKASCLPATAPRPVSLPEPWTVDQALVDTARRALLELEQARATPAAGADTLLGILDKLIASSNLALAGHRDRDECPVCAAPGRGWLQTTIAEAEQLRESAKSLRAAVRKAATTLRELAGCFPSSLPSSARKALLATGGTAALRLAQWDRLAGAAANFTADIMSLPQLDQLVAETQELVTWYTPVQETLQSRREDAVAAQATARTHTENWLGVLEANRAAATRRGVADRLNSKVDQWLRTTRDEVFTPIGDQVRKLWDILNSDSDLKLTNIALAGGTQQARKVQIELVSGDLAVPPAKNSSAIMSTGQRNALSLATYLPRATQPHSPFGFLVLDDPVHVFDVWRVRYLAKHLIDLASRFQIVVFTHDDRLWREIRSLGAKATHIRLNRTGGDKPKVYTADITRPGEQLLRDLEKQLSGEERQPIGDDDARKSMTLALCRQALDTEIVSQLHVLGRRNGLAEADIETDQHAAHTTRDQIVLLDRYARTAGLPNVDTHGQRSTIDALNGGAHGKAPIGQLRTWIKGTRALIRSVNAIGA